MARLVAPQIHRVARGRERVILFIIRFRIRFTIRFRIRFIIRFRIRCMVVGVQGLDLSLRN
jgi:hypothetical protein